MERYFTGSIATKPARLCHTGLVYERLCCMSRDLERYDFKPEHTRHA
jgi:hypothetical protein